MTISSGGRLVVSTLHPGTGRGHQNICLLDLHILYLQQDCISTTVFKSKACFEDIVIVIVLNCYHIQFCQMVFHSAMQLNVVYWMCVGRLRGCCHNGSTGLLTTNNFVYCRINPTHSSMSTSAVSSRLPQSVLPVNISQGTKYFSICIHLNVNMSGLKAAAD